jgi:hypothetical protein
MNADLPSLERLRSRPSTQLVKIASTVRPCSEIDEFSNHFSLGHAERFGSVIAACAEPAENWNSLKERNVILDRHDGPPSRHQFVAAHFSDQGRRSGGVLLDLLP